MKNMSVLRAASAALFLVLSSAAFAQSSGSVTNHALPIGKGPGTTGFGSLPLGSGQIAIGQTSADPSAIAPTGDVTITSAGVTAIGANKVTNTQFRQSGALALVGRSANTTGNVADIQATAGSSCVFMESASTLACGAIATASIAANAITFAKFQQIAALSMFGNCTNALANGTAVTGIANQVLRVNGAGTSCGFGAIDLSQAAAATGVLQAGSEPAHTGDVTNTAGSLALTIGNNAVTNAKMAQGGAATLKGNPTASTANEQDFTIQGLTARGAPDAANDKILIYDNAAATLKYVTPAAVASSAVAGVSSIAGNTGAFTLGGLLSNSTNLLQVVAAGKTDQQTPTSNVLAVTPLHQQDHISAAKVELYVTFSGSTPTIVGSYNVASVSLSSTGNLTVNFTTAFANTNYICHENEVPVSANSVTTYVSTKSTGSLNWRFAESGTVANPNAGDLVCYGSQ